MIICDFCGEQLNDQDALQEHQVVACPAVLHESLPEAEAEAVNVKLKWLVDRVISHTAVHLIGSDLPNTVELKKGNASYTSEPVTINTGKYNAQLVIGDEIIPVALFEVDMTSDVIYLIIERDSTVEDCSTTQADASHMFSTQGNEHSPFSPHLQSPQQLVLADRSSTSSGSPVHVFCNGNQHGEDFRWRNSRDVDIGDFLQEENIPSNLNDVAPAHDGFMRSPDDHTLQHIEDIGDEQAFESSHFPRENQQPVESEAEDYSDPLSPGYQINSNSAADPPHDQNIDDMLLELSMTDQDEDLNERRRISFPTETNEFNEMLNAARLQSESSFHSATQNDLLQQQIEDAMNDVASSHFDENLNQNSGTVAIFEADTECNPAVRDSLHLERGADEHRGDEGMHANRDAALNLDLGDDAIRQGDHSRGNISARSEGSNASGGHDNNERHNGGIPIPDVLQAVARGNNSTGMHSRVTNNEASGYASDLSSQSDPHRGNGDRGTEPSVRRRRTRTHSHSSQHGQEVTSRHEGNNLALYADLKVKCDSYESEMKRMQKELTRLQLLTENYREVKVELETKCQSYDEEVQRWTDKYADLQDELQKEKDEIADSKRNFETEREEMLAQCRRYNDEIEELRRNYEKNAKTSSPYHHNDEDMAIIAELEAKCQSYEMEVERLKKENAIAKKASYVSRKEKVAVEELNEKLSEWKQKCFALDTENKKIRSDNESLDTAHQLHAGDLQIENKRLEKKVSELEVENEKLESSFLNTSPVPSFTMDHSSPDNASRINIQHLKKENQLLKDRLSNIHKEANLMTNDEMAQNGSHQPHIISPRHSEAVKSRSTSGSMGRNSSALASKSTDVSNFKADILPNRHLYKNAFRDQDDVDHGYVRSGPSHYQAERYATYSAPKDMSPSKSRSDRSTDRDDFSRIADEINEKEDIASIMRRYSDRKTYTSSMEDLRSTRTAESIRPRRYTTDFKDDTKYSRRHPKSRSLDLGLDEIGLADDVGMPYRRTSLARIPFCPTTIKQLVISMKISVNRTSGRLSRGTVKWIGTLPRHAGDYVGVELESESGKHNGFFDGVQYFLCKPDRGVFVKFTKVIMAWR